MLLKGSLAAVVLCLAVSSYAAQPPCFDNSNRYVDCGNGTVTDGDTGLIWLKDAGCLGPVHYAEAQQAAAQLADGQCGLTDGSQAGDWRIPTLGEWRTMIKGGAKLGCTDSGEKDPPSLTNDAGDDCLNVGPTSFVNVQFGGFNRYWSASTYPQDATYAAGMNLSTASASTERKADPVLIFYAWPVRGIGGSNPY